MKPASKSIVIPRRPQACWLAFTEVTTLCAWVPGLRSARVLALAPDRMPAEIEFEFVFARKYSLEYTYEGTATAKIVRWSPSENAREGVHGWARFEACEGGTRFEYQVVHGAARTEAERSLDTTEELLEAFARWMTDSSPGDEP